MRWGEVKDPARVPGERHTRACMWAAEPATLTPAHIQALRHAGLDDGEILEINQAVAHFAYANRNRARPGVITEHEVAAASPSPTLTRTAAAIAEPEPGDARRFTNPSSSA